MDSNLKKIMQEKGVKLSVMSLEINCPERTIYDYRSGRYFPNLFLARKIAEYLGVTDKCIWP